MNKQEPSIKCPAFLKQEPGIRKLTDSINQTKNVHEKAAVARELQNEVKVLLDCPDYKSEQTDCQNCRLLATLRKKTADIIIMARKLV